MAKFYSDKILSTDIFEIEPLDHWSARLYAKRSLKAKYGNYTLVSQSYFKRKSHCNKSVSPNVLLLWFEEILPTI